MRQVPAWCWPAETTSSLARELDGVDGASLLEPGFGALGLHFAYVEGVGMDVAGDARDRHSPFVADRWDRG